MVYLVSTGGVAATAPVEGLLYAQHTDAANPIGGAVQHWALPAVDATAAERRAQAVQATADQMTYLVSSLPQNLGGQDIYDIDREPLHRSASEPSETTKEQRRHMVEVTSMLHTHAKAM